MKGSVFAKTLPKDVSPGREQMFLDAVRRRDIAPISWVPIITKHTGPNGREYTAKLLVSKDALRVGDANDSFRFSVNHRTAQLIADELGSVLPTPYLGAEIWRQAIIRLPTLAQTRAWYADPKTGRPNTMSKTYRMLEQSDYLDKMIADEQAKTGKDGLIADVGKNWVTHPKLWLPYTPPPGSHCPPGKPRAMNYGWHLTSGPYRPSTIPGIKVIQPGGLCHLIGHVDYSQVVRLIRRDVEVCGLGFSGGCVKMDIAQIGSSPVLNALVSRAGPLQAMRHPDVPPSCTNRCPASTTPITPVTPSTPPEEPFFPEGPCPAGQVMTSEGCQQAPPLNGEPTTPVEPPPEAGPISCPTGCEKLPDVTPDPTIAYAAMELPATDKVVMLAAGGVVGFMAVYFLLPRL